MSIEALKEQARRHEQKEEWQKALDQYKKAISKLEQEEQPDIGLYNRVGDLLVRVGKLDEAVGFYDRAVDLYMDSQLPNNAIAVCKKVIRNVPHRDETYLRLGQIRALQGFLPDARANFLTYAERKQKGGNLDESFRALVEFCDLAPDDVDVRLAVAEQMETHRSREAAGQYAVAYRTLMRSGDATRAHAVEAKIRTLDPDLDLAAAPAASGYGVGSAISDEGEIIAEFGEIQVGAAFTPPKDGAEKQDARDEARSSEADEAEPLPLVDFSLEDEDEDEAPLPMFEVEEVVDGEEADPLPLLVFETEDEDEEAPPLPLLEGPSEDDEEPAEVLDASSFGEPDRGERDSKPYRSDAEDVEELDVGLADFSMGEREEAMEEAAADAKESAAKPAEVPTAAPAEVPAKVAEAEQEPTLDSLRAEIADTPDDVNLRQRLVERAYQSGDESALVEAYVGLGQTLQVAGQPARAKAAWQQVLHLDPGHAVARAAMGQAANAPRPVKEVSAHTDYVDLGSLILGDEEEKTTRFVVAYEEPSGDEQADFAKMLAQFKAKVAQNLDADDVRAHHDLGTAYKEMGLLDEAVAEFQQALRASANHLPTYEMLGQTFLEMGMHEAAVRSLERALQAPYEVEDDLVAIYYYLGRAYEEVGKKDLAVEFYDRVFTLDINFADVTERLRALR